MTRRLATPAAGVMVAAAAVFSWRALTSPPAASFDPWAYSAWGQAIARGESPSYELASTAPKPLGAFIGALVAPLPVPRGITLVVVLSVALMIAGLFALAQRHSGGAGAGVAVLAVLAGGMVPMAVWLSYIDAIAAALVILGLALHGRARIALWVLAGLLRPEAWALAALAGFLESKGAMWRRIGAAAIAGALPPVLWMGADLVLTGDALATLRWIEEARATDLVGAGTGWTGLPSLFWSALAKDAGAVVAVAGCVGLSMEARRNGPAAGTAALALVIALVWTAGLAVEVHAGLLLQARYLLPVHLMFALGCGFLAARLLPSYVGALGRRSAVGVAVLALGVCGTTMTMSGTPGFTATLVKNARSSLPTVNAALRCGRVGITGKTVARERATITLLAAATRQSPRRFGAASQEPGAGHGQREGFGAILHIDQGGRIFPWPAPLRAPELAVLVKKALLRFPELVCRDRTGEARAASG